MRHPVVVIVAFTPRGDDLPGRLHGRRAVEGRLRRHPNGDPVEQEATFLSRKVVSGLAAVEDADAHVEHALADALGEQLQIDARADLPVGAALLEDLEHGGIDGGRRLAGQLGQILARVGRRLVERQEQSSAVAHGARGDGLAEFDDAIFDWPGVEVM